MRITRDEIEHAHRVVSPHVRVTPVLHSRGTEFGAAPFPLTLKLELLQFAGSFKARGAFANLLLRQVPAAGVAAASGGNHGAAVAYAAQRLGHPARIFVPGSSARAKVDRIRSYGAELCIHGDAYADALSACETWVESSGALPVHAFDQRETILGQGTLGRELAQQAPDVTTILVAVGGGGLISGVASWYQGSVRVVGVEPSNAPTLTNALRAGRPVDAPAGGVAADSLAPRRVGTTVFPIVQAHVERVVTVEDADIVSAQRTLWESARIAAEPGGAAALAALLSGAYRPLPDEHVAVIVCGGNADALPTAGPS